MSIPAKTKRLEPTPPGEAHADACQLAMDSDEEEQAFICEMMNRSLRTTAKDIKQSFGPIGMSE